jgi:type VI secretion system secreted protein Hcp
MSAAAQGGSSQGSMNVTGISSPIPIVNFNFAVISPRDASTGMATGKREWKPLVVTVPWTKSTPHLYALMDSNSALDEVKFVYGDQWIKLSDAQIVNIRSISGGQSKITFVYGGAESGRGAAGRPLTDTMELVRVALTFQKITVGNLGGKTAQDDWTL